MDFYGLISRISKLDHRRTDRINHNVDKVEGVPPPNIYYLRIWPSTQNSRSFKKQRYPLGNLVSMSFIFDLTDVEGPSGLTGRLTKVRIKFPDYAQRKDKI